nr:hypothetical protein [Tanacetum cinerariifolium]
NSLNDSPSISETSSQSPPNINHCCSECGDSLDGIFCKGCTCKFCGKDAHIGYNCPSKVPVISIPEPCNNQTINELPQTLPIFHPTFQSEAESPFTLDSTPTYVDESPNELEENLVTHSQAFQNSSEPSNASTNIVNAHREPNVVKQDNGSFVDKIIFRAPDSPDQFHCFHCKDVLRAGETCKRCTCAKCGSGSGRGKGLCYICGHNQNSLNDSPSISETSSKSSPNINHCCYECGDPLDGIFCKRCPCKSCGKDAHIGYNCPSKVPVISIPEPCNNQTINELPQALPIFHPTFQSEAESPFTFINSLNDSPSISETSSQSPSNINHCCYECGDPLDGIFYKQCTCKSCGKDAHIGYNCPSTVLVISNPEPCNNQIIDELPQTLPSFHPTFHSEAESPFTLDSTPTYVNESPNVFNPPP